MGFLRGCGECPAPDLRPWHTLQFRWQAKNAQKLYGMNVFKM